MDLSYHTDLRELNELNFARFDAKLEQRLAELRGDLLVELRTGLQQIEVSLGLSLGLSLYQVRTELVGWMFGVEFPSERPRQCCPGLELAD